MAGPQVATILVARAPKACFTGAPDVQQIRFKTKWCVDSLTFEQMYSSSQSFTEFVEK